MVKPPRRNVVELPVARVLGPMRDRIRELAADTRNVAFSDHALSQMWDRDIADVDVFRVLRLGEIAGVPWEEPETKEHACKVTYRRAGSRVLGVVTIVLHEGKLLVKTAEWEDER